MKSNTSARGRTTSSARRGYASPGSNRNGHAGGVPIEEGLNPVLGDFVKELQLRDNDGSSMAHVELVPSRPATYGNLSRPLHTELAAMLASRGIERLYSHQATAVNLIRDRSDSHAIVSTTTASGKSLCYQIPVFDALMENSNARALYMFPTKALAHDQLDSLRGLTPGGWEIRSDAYDGDTPREDRPSIKQQASIVITNPDMVHVGMLPYHRGWRRFLQNLRFVVLDEAHFYRGVFGAHVAMIIRRLRRVCREFGSNPQFILCSATLANAGEHAENLTGLPFHVVDGDGSPSGGRTFVFWNPYAADESGRGRSLNMEAAEITSDLVARDVKTMTFARSRSAVERICEFAQDNLGRGRGRRDSIQPYRAGYLADYRRRIERELKQGSIRGLVTTNAMELGVDVGGVDATVLSGYPGTVSSVWQQAGRSGRSEDRAVSVLIARDHPVDQFFMENPKEFFVQPYEAARVSTTNPMVLEQHLRCAADEAPLGRRDFDIFGERPLRVMGNQMVKDGTLVINNDMTRSLARDQERPAFGVNIRSMDSARWRVVDRDSGEVLEQTDADRVFMDLYPGAIHVHRGQYYSVQEVDRDASVVLVKFEDNPKYYTVLDIESEIKVLHTAASRIAGASKVSFGTVEVRNKAEQYFQKSRYTDDVIDVIAVDVAPRVYQTHALWWEEPRGGRTAEDEAGRPMFSPSATSGAFDAMEYPAAGALSMFAMCDESDIGASSYLTHPDVGQRASVFVWDAHPGGVGIAQLGYEMAERLWDRMLGIIEGCRCKSGCPRCVESPNRFTEDSAPDKAGAIRVLRAMLSDDGPAA